MTVTVTHSTPADASFAAAGAAAWDAGHDIAGLDAAAVGLGNVDNTSDASKPISTATQTALDGKQVAGTYASGTGSASGTNTGDNATNTQYSGLAASKQDALVSGTSIKTVNSTSLLGSGDIAVQASLVSGTNIKTVNSTSLLGSGDVAVQATLVSATNIKTINSSSILGSGDLVVSGSDPWTYLTLSSDFTTSSGTAVDVTGLAFTPGANKKYEIEGQFRLRTATATVGPRPGCAWPTGLSDGTITFWTTSSATAQLVTNGNISAAVLVAVGGLPTNTLSYPGQVQGNLTAGATPSGTFKIQLASETAGTNVIMKAGSFIKYREY